MCSLKSYRSKPGYAVWGMVMVSMGIFVGKAVREGNKEYLLFLILLSIVVFIWLGYVIRSTRYTIIDEKWLRIRSAPWPWPDIRINDITSIERSFSPFYAPAPSLKRIRIRYGKKYSVMISPELEAEFIAEVRRINPGIEIKM